MRAYLEDESRVDPVFGPHRSLHFNSLCKLLLEFPSVNPRPLFMGLSTTPTGAAAVDYPWTREAEMVGHGRLPGTRKGVINRAVEVLAGD